MPQKELLITVDDLANKLTFTVCQLRIFSDILCVKSNTFRVLSCMEGGNIIDLHDYKRGY